MELETRRLRLREFVEADRPAFLAYQADPRSLAFRGPEHSTADHADRLLAMFREWSLELPRLNYQLAITPKGRPGELIGCCGLRMAGCPAGVGEIGIELSPDWWGRHGYAVEVGHALIAFGFDQLSLDELRGTTVSANQRIARLAEWFGAERHDTRTVPGGMSDHGWDETEWRIVRAQWARRSQSRIVRGS